MTTDRHGATNSGTVRLFVLASVGLATVGGLAVIGTGSATGAPGSTVAVAQATPTDAPTDPLVGDGEALYLERCASCHAAEGEGVAGSGPAIVGRGAALYDFMMSTGRMPVDRPVQQAGRKQPVLSRQEIDAITAYLVSLAPGGPAIPNVYPETGNISRGSEIYQVDCAPCHGAGGNGGAVGDRAAPGLHAATALEIAEAIRAGPGTMPVFDEETLTQSEMDSVVRYVLYLRDFEDRGGLPLDHVGPLVEGFIAFTLGLGLLVLLTRYIGERS